MVEVPDVTLKNMLEQALAAYAAMSPVERAIHDDAQRRSFLRGQTGRDPGENPLVTEIMQLRTDLAAAKNPEAAILVTALDRIAHMHRAEAMIAIAALHKYDPSRRVLNESPLPAIDTTIKPPASYYPERQG